MAACRTKHSYSVQRLLSVLPYTYSCCIAVIWECVFAESEEDMKRDDVDIIIEEAFGRMIDLLLNTEDVREAYQQGDGHTWVGCIGDEFLQEGLRHLDGQMLSIIESLVFEDMTIYEVSQHLGIDTDSVYEKIQESRKVLLRFI